VQLRRLCHAIPLLPAQRLHIPAVPRTAPAVRNRSRKRPSSASLGHDDYARKARHGHSPAPAASVQYRSLLQQLQVVPGLRLHLPALSRPAQNVSHSCAVGRGGPQHSAPRDTTVQHRCLFQGLQVVPCFRLHLPAISRAAQAVPEVTRRQSCSMCSPNALPRADARSPCRDRSILRGECVNWESDSFHAHDSNGRAAL
jgi:hypothetical protein